MLPSLLRVKRPLYFIQTYFFYLIIVLKFFTILMLNFQGRPLVRDWKDRGTHIKELSEAWSSNPKAFTLETIQASSLETFDLILLPGLNFDQPALFLFVWFWTFQPLFFYSRNYTTKNDIQRASWKSLRIVHQPIWTVLLLRGMNHMPGNFTQ